MNTRNPLQRSTRGGQFIRSTLRLSVEQLEDRTLLGSGTFTRLGAGEAAFNFCVSVRFNASPRQLDQIQSGFENASQILADATDGKNSARFGRIACLSSRIHF